MSNAAASGVVQLANVSISYGSNRALRDVTAVFQPGAVGLLGPNGAGRSTMLRALLGFLSSGTPPPRVDQPSLARGDLGYEPGAGYTCGGAPRVRPRAVTTAPKERFGR